MKRQFRLHKRGEEQSGDEQAEAEPWRRASGGVKTAAAKKRSERELLWQLVGEGVAWRMRNQAASTRPSTAKRRERCRVEARQKRGE